MRFNNFPKVTHQACGRAGNQTQFCLASKLRFFLLRHTFKKQFSSFGAYSLVLIRPTKKGKIVTVKDGVEEIPQD